MRCLVGRKNRHCLCETCEKIGRGGYAPENPGEDLQLHSDLDSDSDSESYASSDSSEAGEPSQSNVNLDERRTRRGVYAVMAKKDDESDESDDEDGNVVPLADAPDIPADGEIELTSELGTPSDLTSLTASIPPPNAMASSSSLVTPSPDSRLPSCSSLSSLSCISGSTSKSPFRSIISTRGQKARETQATSSHDANHQLSTPPLSEDAEPPSSRETPSTRITRSASSLHLCNETKGKAKDPTSDLTPTRGLNAVGKGEMKIKKEEVEPRSLRARPSPVTQPESSQDPPLIPRGPDGEPLPTCVTCLNILPVISVDSKVVWGLGVESSPRKKKVKQECPRYVPNLINAMESDHAIRCMRHGAIYGQPWPSRVTQHGAGSLPTPREAATPAESTSSKRLSKKSLSIVNNKLAATAVASTKPRKRDDDLNDRPKKRQKVERSPKADLGARVKKVVLRTDDKKQSSLSAPLGEKRKRGRPRLSSPRRVVKLEEKVVQITGPQPRNANGRFEKKIRVGKRPLATANPPIVISPHEMVSKREAAVDDSVDDGGVTRAAATWTSPRHKRSGDVKVHLGLQPRKRVLRSGGALDEAVEPFKKVLPRPRSNFKGGKLFSNPNPLSFALQAWAGPMIVDESSEDEQPPVTPPEEDNPSLTMVVEADTTHNLSTPLLFSPPSIPFGPLTSKPSPFHFAKRRWISTSSSCTDRKLREDFEGGDAEMSLEGKEDQRSLGYRTTITRRHSFSSRYTLRPQSNRALSSDQKVCYFS